MNKEENNVLKERLEELSIDEENFTLYTELTNEELLRNTYVDRAKNEGIEVGKAEGQTQKAIEIVKNMIKIGLEDEVISKSVGLSLEELEKLKNNIHN